MGRRLNNQNKKIGAKSNLDKGRMVLEIPIHTLWRTTPNNFEQKITFD